MSWYFIAFKYLINAPAFRIQMMNHCKELCGQELEQEVLAAEKKLIQQRLLLDSLKKEVNHQKDF